MVFAGRYIVIDKEIAVRKQSRYLGSKIWKNNRKTLYFSFVFLILQIMIPYISLWIPKIIVDGVTRQTQVWIFIRYVLMGCLFLVIASCIKESMEGKLTWYRRSFVNVLLREIDHKTMTVEYKMVEGTYGQLLRQKALNAVYECGQNMIGVVTSFFANVFGLILYAATVGSVNPILLLVIFITVLLEYYIAGKAKQYAINQKEQIAKLDRKLTYLETNADSLAAGREIRLYQMKDLFVNIYIKTIQIRVAVEKTIAQKGLFFDSLKCLVAICRTFFSYVYLFWLVWNGRLEIGNFVLSVGIISGLSVWMSGVMDDFGEIKKIFLYFNDFFEYLNMPEYSNSKNKKENSVLFKETDPMEIKLKHVYFRYEGAEQDTLKDICLTIKKGEKLALVGKNGSGKTTLVKLLSGLYRPTKGEIFVNEVNITQYDPKEYFCLVSAVFQEIMFLPVSIAQNISSSMIEQIEEDWLKQCITKVGMDEKIGQLSEGIHTLQLASVRENAVDFSGGEQQKLWIAKAIYKNGAILFLDEPTAALDPIAESKIYKNYKDVVCNSTSVFVSHRLASTNFCDRIILLANGVIAEEGTHKKLLEESGQYSKMFEVQSKYYKRNY